MSFLQDRHETIAAYERGIRGEVDVHAWDSDKLGPLMRTEITPPGVGVDLTGGYEIEFAVNLGIHYSGIMPPEALAQRIDDFRRHDQAYDDQVGL